MRAAIIGNNFGYNAGDNEFPISVDLIDFILFNRLGGGFPSPAPDFLAYAEFSKTHLPHRRPT
jgi:hypothetical protein